MSSRISLVEQKKLQWAKEREEMARLSGHSESRKARQQNAIHTNIRTYRTNTRLSARDALGTEKNKPLRAVGNYGSTSSLQSLVDQHSTHTTTSLRSIDFSTGSLINLLDGTDFPGVSRRSPSLPPIYTKDNQPPPRHVHENTKELAVDGSRYSDQARPQKQYYHQLGRKRNGIELPYEEREGETSGYGSDSIEAPVTSIIPNCSGSLGNNKRLEGEMSERTWQNPYCETPDASLPGSRGQSITKLGELNRQRWGSLWGAENSGKSDPPAPSWLERGLSRLDNSSQILVINHDGASSPDSSTTDSTGSDPKTYIRGQNIPVDAQVLQERETRRQRALELQNAIKQQLEEKDKQRKADKERKLWEERREEERIKKDRDREKERLEEEQRIMREKECAKLRKEEAMKEVLKTAERKAREEKKSRRQRDESRESPEKSCPESNCWESSKSPRAPESTVNATGEDRQSETILKSLPVDDNGDAGVEDAKNYGSSKGAVKKSIEDSDDDHDDDDARSVRIDRPSNENNDNINTLRLPVGKEVAIVLSGRLDDAEFLNRANIQLVNLVVTSPRQNENTSTSPLNRDLNALIKTLEAPVILRKSARTIISPRIFENRVLTPSKYRSFAMNGHDFGTQTDGESELQDSKDCSLKDRKEVANNNRRDVEKSTNTGAVEETTMKSLARSKIQPRTTLETRPRWNANRPGTRYRTQSEKDPHYQRRMRLRRRPVDSSDERSRSPSPDRRKSNHPNAKNRTFNRRRAKTDSYDADLSMDSLNSVVPLRIDEHGRVNILPGDGATKRNKKTRDDDSENKNNEKLDLWCRQEILSQLASLRNLDDLLRDDKKDGNLIPDLSKATCNSQEEYRRLHERCPEYKIKPEKVKKEDTKIRDKNFSWRTTKKELKAMDREWLYGDPIPPDMRSLNLQELQQVAIDWRMLTPLRPKLRQDEEMFSRLVEMGKFEAKTLARERRISVSPIRRSKNRSGIIESSVKICGECGEEYCFGESCGDIAYELFTRITLSLQQPKVKVSSDTAAIIAGMNGGKRKRKRKGKRAKVGLTATSSRTVGRKKVCKIAKKSETSKDDENANETRSKKFKRKCSKFSKKAARSTK